MKSQVGFLNVGVLLLGLVVLGGCTDKPVPGNTTNAPLVPDPARIARGTEVYRQNCASCHGERAQGVFNWQKPGADGKYPPPPLDGSAHAWHHPTAALKDVIANGTQRIGGNMPPWRDKLSETDIEAVIMYFQSLWPTEIYQTWADMDRRARTGSAK